MNSLDSRNRERIHSSLQLFLSACHLWGRMFENDDLLSHLQDMETALPELDLQDLSEDTVGHIEETTLKLIYKMDAILKSLGADGICYDGTKH